LSPVPFLTTKFENRPINHEKSEKVNLLKLILSERDVVGLGIDR